MLSESGGKEKYGRHFLLHGEHERINQIQSAPLLKGLTAMIDSPVD